MLLRLLINLLVHFTLAVCYPHMGGRGLFLVALSFVLWSLGLILGGILLNMIRFLMGPFKFLEGVLLALLIGFSLAYVMPQKDGRRVSEKIAAGQLPSKADLRYGLAQFGLDKAGGKTAAAVSAETQKAADVIDKHAAPVTALAAEGLALAAKKVEKEAGEISRKAQKSANEAKKKETGANRK